MRNTWGSRYENQPLCFMIPTLQKSEVFTPTPCIHPATAQKCTHLAEMKHGTCAMTYKYPEETKQAEVPRPKGWFWWSVHTGTAVACVFCWETSQCLTKNLVWGLTHEKPSQALQLSREVVEVYLTCMPFHVKIMNRQATSILSWRVCASFLHVQCTLYIPPGPSKWLTWAMTQRPHGQNAWKQIWTCK